MDEDAPISGPSSPTHAAEGCGASDGDTAPHSGQAPHSCRNVEYGWLTFDATAAGLEAVLDALLRLADERHLAQNAALARMCDTPDSRQRIDNKFAELHRPDIYEALSALATVLATIESIQDALDSEPFRAASALVDFPPKVVSGVTFLRNFVTARANYHSSEKVLARAREAVLRAICSEADESEVSAVLCTLIPLRFCLYTSNAVYAWLRRVRCRRWR